MPKTLILHNLSLCTATAYHFSTATTNILLIIKLTRHLLHAKLILLIILLLLLIIFLNCVIPYTASLSHCPSSHVLFVFVVHPHRPPLSHHIKLTVTLSSVLTVICSIHPTSSFLIIHLRQLCHIRLIIHCFTSWLWCLLFLSTPTNLDGIYLVVKSILWQPCATHL